MLGEAALRGIFCLEEWFSHIPGKVGTYPLIVIEKGIQDTTQPTAGR